MPFKMAINTMALNNPNKLENRYGFCA